MKKCINCKSIVRDSDKYCRICGCNISKNIYYIILSIATSIMFIMLLLLIILFIASYFV